MQYYQPALCQSAVFAVSDASGLMSDSLISGRLFISYLEAPGPTLARLQTVLSQSGDSPKQLDFQMPFSIGFKSHLLRILSPKLPI